MQRKEGELPKSFYEATIILIPQRYHTKRKQLIFDKGKASIMEKRYSFAQTIGYSHAKNESRNKPMPFMKINSEQIMNLNEKFKTIKCVEEI